MKKIAAILGLSLLVPNMAWANMPVVENPLLNGVVLTITFAAVGILIMLCAYKIIDGVTPGNLGKELTENKNVALAIVVGSMVVGVSIIISAALLG